jgi:hypothetical protein
VNNEALREKFRVWQLARQTTAAGLLATSNDTHVKKQISLLD